MYVVLIYKYEKSIYDLKQKSLLISDTENMLISNTNVTFKYECYLFSTNGTPYLSKKFVLFA